MEILHICVVIVLEIDDLDEIDDNDEWYKSSQTPFLKNDVFQFDDDNDDNDELDE